MMLNYGFQEQRRLILDFTFWYRSKAQMRLEVNLRSDLREMI